MKQKSTSIIAFKCFHSFVRHTVHTCGSAGTGLGEEVRMKVHTYLTSNFGFQLLRQRIVSAYNIAAVCCNSHVRKSMFPQILLRQYRGKTIYRHSAFRVSLQNFMVSFDTHKPFKKLCRLLYWFPTVFNKKH